MNQVAARMPCEKKNHSFHPSRTWRFSGRRNHESGRGLFKDSVSLALNWYHEDMWSWQIRWFHLKCRLGSCRTKSLVNYLTLHWSVGSKLLMDTKRCHTRIQLSTIVGCTNSFKSQGFADGNFSSLSMTYSILSLKFKIIYCQPWLTHLILLSVAPFELQWPASIIIRVDWTYFTRICRKVRFCDLFVTMCSILRSQNPVGTGFYQVQLHGAKRLFLWFCPW